MHPLVVKHVLLPLHEKIIGRDTLHYLDELERSQWWPVDQLRDLQQTKLHALLRHAHAKSPYHRRRLDAAGINPDRVTLDNLHRLPTLTKADIAEHSRDIIDPSVPGGLHRLTTGGSTGSPLAFCVDRSRQAADQAARARTRRWFGIDLGQRELYLWGSPVEQAAQDRIKRLRDAVTNHRLLNAFKMTPSQMSRYLDEIRRFDPVHIFGYPSSIARLVRHAVAAGRTIRNHSLKAVFTTGELFLPSDRAVIEEHAGVPVADGYGSREAGFIAQQCPSGSYHVTMESLIVELIDADGRPVPAGRPGEIAITHLDAFGMPFIRYRTGDVARRSPDPCPCGRGLECLDIIEGRRTDMLRTTAGGFAHALSVIYVLRDEPAVREFKIIQRPTLDLDVYVVPRTGENKPLISRCGENKPLISRCGENKPLISQCGENKALISQCGENKALLCSEKRDQVRVGQSSALPAGAAQTADASLPSRTPAAEPGGPSLQTWGIDLPAGATQTADASLPSRTPTAQPGGPSLQTWGIDSASLQTWGIDSATERRPMQGEAEAPAEPSSTAGASLPSRTPAAEPDGRFRQNPVPQGRGRPREDSRVLGFHPKWRVPHSCTTDASLPSRTSTAQPGGPSLQTWGIDSATERRPMQGEAEAPAEPSSTLDASLPSRPDAPSSSSFILPPSSFPQPARASASVSTQHPALSTQHYLLLHPSSFPASSAHRIIALLKRQIGDTIDVRLHLVDSIEADPSGKHRYVVSEA